MEEDAFKGGISKFIEEKCQYIRRRWEEITKYINSGDKNCKKGCRNVNYEMKIESKKKRKWKI